MRSTLLLAVCAATALCMISGCSDSLVATEGIDKPAPAPAAVHTADPKDQTSIGQSIASLALNDRELGSVRGGLSISSGVVLNFAFQEATYVNHDLVQNIVTPTITVSPGSTVANVGGMTVSGGLSGFSPNSVAALANSAAQAPVNSPAMAVQSIVNNGMTSIVSNLGGSGLASVIANTASNQTVQQVINANVDIAGLTPTIQQSIASTILNRVQAATSQFR